MKQEISDNSNSGLLKWCIPVLMAAFIAPSVNAADVDWGQVDSKQVKVFYPGVASWEFLLADDHGQGAKRVRSMGKTCAECHVGDEGDFDIYADDIISGELKKSESGEPFEPDPIDGMSGFKDVSVQVAHDDENIYVRLEWPGSGASFNDASLAANDKADRVSLQIANQIKTFDAYGCFITCHDDQEGMPEDAGDDKHLYAYYTHNSKGQMAPQGRLDSHISKQQFMDLWIAGFNGEEVEASDQYVLESRHDDNEDLSATGSYENGNYSVVITRKLSTDDDKDIQFADGETFSVGIAIHDGGHGDRHHYTSFPVSIGLSTSADITSKKL